MIHEITTLEPCKGFDFTVRQVISVCDRGHHAAACTVFVCITVIANIIPSVTGTRPSTKKIILIIGTMAVGTMTTTKKRLGHENAHHSSEENGPREYNTHNERKISWQQIRKNI